MPGKSFKPKDHIRQCPHCKALILHEDRTFCKKCGEFLRTRGNKWWNYDKLENAK